MTTARSAPIPRRDALDPGGPDSKVWLITGCSTGFGRALCEQLLARGDRVLMTVRDRATLADLIASYPSSARAFALDIADVDLVPGVVAQADAVFGRIDVLVNNAGYFLFGGVEEATPVQYREIFEVNFFGALEMMRAVLPSMRARRDGRIINISSMGGISGGVGAAYYAATKFALTAVSESLALEAKHLGIRVTLIEPGAHRTSVRQNWRQADGIFDYAQSTGVLRELLKNGAGSEPGCPQRAARAIIAIADSPDPPMHLPLGRDAVARVEDKIAMLNADMADWRNVSLSTEITDSVD